MQSVCPIMHSLNISLPSSLLDRNFTGAHCAIVPWCPPPPGYAPLTGPHCNPQLVYINLSHFSCKDFRMVHNFNKRKLLFCSACSGNNTHIRTLGCTAGGSYWHSKKYPQTWTDSQCGLQKITAVIK